MPQAALTTYVLKTLLSGRAVDRRDRVLCVCAGEFDKTLFEGLGFTDVTLTNIDAERGVTPGAVEPRRSAGGSRWERADAQRLPYADESFDVTFVNDGLHHCRSPHRALTEMYRVARLATIVVENRDSFALRLGTRLRAVRDFELNARLLATREVGGVDFGPVPNHVFRWTEREFTKTLRSFDPAHDIGFQFFHNVQIPARFGSLGRGVGQALATLAPRQGNGFAMVALRWGPHPWLTRRDGNFELRLEIGSSDEVTPARRRPKRHVLRSPDVERT